MFSTPFAISPTFWDKRRSGPKKTYPDFEQMNDRLSLIEQGVNDYMSRSLHPTADGLRSYLQNISGQGIKKEAVELPPVEDNTMLGKWKEYLKIKKPKLDENSYRSYKGSRKEFKRFLESVGKTMIKPEQFTHTLYQEYSGWLAERFSPNTEAKQIKRLVMFMNFAAKNKVAFDVNVADIKYKETAGRKISLTWEQVVALSELKLSGRLDRIRDTMIIQCAVGLRISDLFRIRENIQGDRLVIQQEKTDKPISMPLPKMVRDILQKYGSQPPVISEAKYRKGIKEVYALIDEKTTMQIRNYKTDKFETVRICDEISSHDLVRTFITVSAEKGMAIPHIAKIVGKTEDIIYRHYLNVTQEAAEREYLKAWDQ